MYRVRQAHWAGADEAALRHIRETVFMQEQQVPEALEWDGEDAAATHLLAESADGNPIGCTRILADGHIGRMAVLKPWRGQGVGSALLQRAVEVVSGLGCREAFLDAQSYAIPFYERHGFHAEGPEFDDAGLPHRHMRCALPIT